MEEIDVRGIKICNMFFIRHSLQKIVHFFYMKENTVTLTSSIYTAVLSYTFN